MGELIKAKLANTRYTALSQIEKLKKQISSTQTKLDDMNTELKGWQNFIAEMDAEYSDVAAVAPKPSAISVMPNPVFTPKSISK
jgi:hypothetical protein